MLNSSTNTSNMTNLPHAQSNSSPPPSGTESVSPSLPSNTLPPNSQHSHPKMTPPFLSVDPPPPSADPPPSSSLPNPPSHTASVSVIAVPTQSPRQSSPQDQTSPAPTTSLLPVVARPTQSPSDTLTNTPTNVAPSSHSAAQPPTSHPSDSKPLVSQPPTAPPPSAPTPTALPSTAQPPSPQLPSPQPSALSPPTSPPTVSPPSQDLPTAHPTKPPVSNPLPSSPTTDQCMEQNNNCEQNPSRYDIYYTLSLSAFHVIRSLLCTNIFIFLHAYILSVFLLCNVEQLTPPLTQFLNPSKAPTRKNPSQNDKS